VSILSELALYSFDAYPSCRQQRDRLLQPITHRAGEPVRLDHGRAKVDVAEQCLHSADVAPFDQCQQANHDWLRPAFPGVHRRARFASIREIWRRAEKQALKGTFTVRYPIDQKGRQAVQCLDTGLN
jgi:hypothetical protein